MNAIVCDATSLPLILLYTFQDCYILVSNTKYNHDERKYLGYSVDDLHHHNKDGRYMQTQAGGIK